MMDFIQETDRIYMKDPEGRLLAEITFPAESGNASGSESSGNFTGVVNINHTYVDPSLRGQGVAGKLMSLTVVKLRQEQKKALATCSFAVQWLKSHPECEDILYRPLD